MRLRVGVQLPEVERAVPWSEMVAMARAVEDAGFDSMWLGDHLLYDLPDGSRGPWEVWTALAGLASVTERVELGPFVASTSFHAPAVLAKMAATVDAISGGRLVLGLGAGWNQREYTAYGFPFDKRVARFEEAFTIIRELVRTGRCDFRGEFYEVADCILDPRPVRPGGPPLLLGSISPRMMRLALPYVDAWNVWWSDYRNDVDGFVAVRRRVDDALAEAGRAPGDVEATAAVFVHLPGGVGRLAGETNEDPTIRAVPLAELAEHLRAMGDAGAAQLQLVLDPITVESIEAVGDVVRSVLRPDGGAVRPR